MTCWRNNSATTPVLVTALMDWSIDPVALTILAVNRLGPATFRTVWQGREVTVTVPDRETLEIFRAALDEMQKARSTDRLIRVELATAVP
jgi:hypothetical protein